jgi:hypothetical protein
MSVSEIVRSQVWLASAVLVSGAGCSQVDYIEIKPDTLVIKQKSNEIWLQGHAMSHTGVQDTRARIAWSTVDPSIAEVDEKGRLVGLKSGRTDVVAKFGKVEARMPVDVLFADKLAVEPKTVTVVEGGPSVELKVKVFDYQGRELKDRTAAFRSGNKEVVSMGQNAVFGLAPGQTQVEVLVEGLSEKVDVTVEADKKVANKK